MATLYDAGQDHVSGQVYDVKPKNNKFFTYEELRDIVGGLIEIVPLPNGKSMVVNEEGKLIGLPENKFATEMWKKEYPIEKYPYNNDELVVGNALVCTEEELNSEEE